MVSSLEEKELMGSNLLNDYVFSSLMTLPWFFGVGSFVLNYFLSQA